MPNCFPKKYYQLAAFPKLHIRIFFICCQQQILSWKTHLCTYTCACVAYFIGSKCCFCCSKSDCTHDRQHKENLGEQDKMRTGWVNESTVWGLGRRRAFLEKVPLAWVREEAMPPPAPVGLWFMISWGNKNVNICTYVPVSISMLSEEQKNSQFVWKHKRLNSQSNLEGEKESWKNQPYWL